MAAAKFTDKSTPENDAKFSSVSSKQGELARPGTDAKVADLNAKTFSETRRTGDGVPS